ncbi:hypothetical protein QE152_g25662 [Popillia japonica]|uniref:Uncharacterized protein n=1 Tax=Popillia japonica TaxID=7064 RepID=A0AAW1K170_POPJA
MAYKNCWKNCTPLESGLGLGLIVSVAFLLVMIVVYLSGDTTISTIFGPKYYSCKKACECLTDFTKLLFFPLHPDIERELPKDLQPFFVGRALTSQLHPTFCLGKNYSIGAIVQQRYADNLEYFECLGKNYSIGAIVQQRYADNLEYFEFIASAAILSSKWLLSYTSLDDSTPDSVYAAVGSKYWSKSGYIHKVQTTIPLNELILLKLKANIIINMEFVKLLGPTDVQTVSVTTWNPAYKHKTALETNFYSN